MKWKQQLFKKKNFKKNKWFHCLLRELQVHMPDL